VAVVSMGNPHAVQLVADVDRAPVAEQGALLEKHARFARGVNAGFVQVVARERARLRVWERGAGETLACGTGACAALVAAVLTGRAERRATLELRGGRLGIEWRERGEGANHVMMTGEAVEVYSGEVEVDEAELTPVVA